MFIEETFSIIYFAFVFGQLNDSIKDLKAGIKENIHSRETEDAMALSNMSLN